MKLNLTDSGHFVVGCNYWASHAGVKMWSNWQPEVVLADMIQLSAEGMQVLRVFPLWPDFQPITQLYSAEGTSMDVRFGELPLPDGEAGRAGVSVEAMEHFRYLADQAHQQGLKLIVGLVTGWMSGRLFVPPALERLNVLTDPFAIQWQIRFVRYFTHIFRDHPAILAWDLGNECNVMARVEKQEQSWLWTASIANAIRVEDNNRPILSGMHSLKSGRQNVWRIQDQAELTDMLTTHPYPVFTWFCDQDPINTLRNGLHATAESCFYADIGGIPCLAEEVGTLGPMICSETIAASYIRMVLLSLWAHDCKGMLWWCAYDQTLLQFAPYDWNAHERELGLIREDRTSKPVLLEIGKFAHRIRELPFDRLPLRRCDAVCILSEGQDQWASAYSSFILAKQAGFDLEFQMSSQRLKEADFYLMPSVSGATHCSKRFWAELMERVASGATLYFSHDDCFHTPFTIPFGVEIQTRERVGGDAVSIEGIQGCGVMQIPSMFRLRMKTTTASTLASEPDGNPMFTCNQFGKGRIYFLGVPLETQLAHMTGAFHKDGCNKWWHIYRQIAAPFLTRRLVTRENSMIGLTEHYLPDGSVIVVAVNYSPYVQSTRLKYKEGWAPSETLFGPKLIHDLLSLEANDGSVFRLNISNG